ncbi:sensor histidine kinase [Mucilaginibacter glaciei]|uniref:histidine kinase n=1 Tax=Mucilaginibacter glaciei TaxID=2772109 RepID=A0A926NTX9_9SPHI|nr:histidine kinase [Mucilaginibacter glaciei]MBD1394655.1 hypothetical protein [Mucilaginibacter glaciei]
MFKQAIIAIVLFFITLPKYSSSQSNTLQPALDLPTRIIYDLFVDRHGFLWIATDLGVSRYDGINIINFSNPSQSSLAATGLCEDSDGKIWFNNFTGQIFYIEYEQMKLLGAYKADEESRYPKIAIFGRSLVATSDKGLFVLNTQSLTAKYVKSNNSATSPTTSLAVLKNRVIVNGKSGWFVYENNDAYRQIQSDDLFKGSAANLSTLNITTLNDTAFLQTNPAGKVKKIFIKNDTVKTAQTFSFESFINSTTISAAGQWVNTIKGSYHLGNKDYIQNLNISDVVIDLEGNQWISTLDKGLFVKYKKNPGIIELNIESVTSNSDLISASLKWKNNLLFGTKKGRFLTYNAASNSIIKTESFGGNVGAINSLTAIDGSTLYLGFINFTRKIDNDNVITDLPIKYVREIIKIDQFTFMASTDGLFAMPENRSDSLKKKFTGLWGGIFRYDEKNNWFYLNKKCRSVSYYPKKKSLIVAFKNGLFEINTKALTQIFYQNQPIYSSSVCFINGSIYVGTFNKGLLIYHSNSIKQVSSSEGLLSTSVFKLKPIAGHLWIMGSGPLQLLDPITLKFINHYDLPTRQDAQVTDVEELNGNAYLTTLNGLLMYSLDKKTIKSPPKNYLLGITVNNQKISTVEHQPLHYSQNNFSFEIGIPSYYYGKSIYLKYSLTTGNDPIWKVSLPGARVLNFPLLKPGSYTFKAVSIDPKSDLNGQVITYKFEILAPWWQRTWVRIFIIIFVLALINYFLISYYLNTIAFQRAFYAEQESLRTERLRISGEIHDDIGSGLFAIHLYADLASKKRKDVKEILEISTMVSEISDKIREIIWSTNIENDNLENLLYYIQFQLSNLFQNSAIEFKSLIPDDIINVNISSQARRDIYLISKELAYNTIKHSKANNAALLITLDDNFVHLNVQDDGVGFNEDNIKIDSMGIENIKLRVKRLKALLTIDNGSGTSITIAIPISEIQTKKFKETLKKWQILVFDIFKRSHFSDEF